MGLLGNILSGGASILGNLLSRALGSLFNTLKQIPGQILGFARNLFVNAANVVNVAFRGLLVGLAASVGGLVLAFKSAINSAQEFGKAALSLRANTGASYGQAGKLLTRGLAFGMSPGDTAGNFSGQNPFMAMLRGGNSSNYYTHLSREYNGYLNQGPMGVMMGHALLKGRGATDADLNIAAMDPRKVRGQEQWSQNISSKLGLDPKSIQSAAEDLSLGLAKLGTIFELLKLKLWSAIGPQVIAGIEKFASFLTSNAGRISNVLERIGGALSTVFLRGLTVALNFLDRNAGKIEGFIYKAFNFLLFDFPPLLMRAGAWIARGIGFILKVFASGVATLIKYSPAISQFFNDLTSSFISNIPAILQASTNLYVGLYNLVVGLGNLTKYVIGLLPPNIPGLSPASNSPAQNTASQGPGSQQNPSQKNATPYSTTVPNTTGFWGGVWPRIGATAAGVAGGWAAGAPVGAVAGGMIGAPIGAVVGGILGAGAGGIGFFPGLAAGWSGGAGIGATAGTIAGGIGGAAVGGWAAYQAASAAQTAYGGGPNGGLWPGQQNQASHGASGNASSAPSLIPSLLQNPQTASILAGIATSGNGMVQSALSNLNTYGPNWAKDANAKSKEAFALADELEKKADEWPAEIARLLAEANNRLSSIDKNTKEGVTAAYRTGEGVNVLARSMTYAAQDAAYAARR